jgi:hypothetical protein
MVPWPKRDVYVRLLHLSSRLDALSQVDFLLELLSLCLRGDGYATSKNHIDLSHLFIIIGGIDPAVFTLMGFLGHRSCWW